MHPSPKTIHLKSAIANVLNAMELHGYSRMGPKHICTFLYEQLTSYANERNLQEVDINFCKEFLRDIFEIDYDRPRNTRTNYKNQLVRGINLLFDFEDKKRIRRRITEDYTESCQSSQNFEIKKFLKDYRSFLIKNELGTSSIALHLVYANKLLMFLEIKDIKTLKTISLKNIDSFIVASNFKKLNSAKTCVYSIRHLIRFLYQTEIISADFSRDIKCRNDLLGRELPVIWSDSQIKKVLSACNIESPTGKRDYAIIMLALRTGLRAIDIINLKFENFDWKNSLISLTQQKTKEPLTLPLPTEVGWAIIKYIKSGRPPSNSKYVFIRHHPPFEKFEASNSLSYIIEKLAKLAGLEFDSPHKMHSLRHTFASRHVNNNTPIPIICSLLGHTSVKSTDNYLRIDIKNLRQCCLNIEELLNDER